MANNFIKIDGITYLEHQLPELFPLSLVKYSDTFKEVINIIVQDIHNIDPDSDLYPLYLNLLSSKSYKVKFISILIEISSFCKIEEISLDYFSAPFHKFLSPDIKIKSTHNKVNFIDSQETVGSLSKCLINQIFVLLGFFFKNKNLEKKNLIRAWVDVDEKLHLSEIKDSVIYIYPFGLNFIRSIKFIKKCFRKNYDVQLMGISYSLLDFLKILFSKDRLKSIVIFEHNAMKKHSKKIKRFSRVFTSDEFQIGTPSLYSNLTNTEVINRAHGLGCYNVRINYDQFYVFNEVQKRYYKNDNPSVDYKFYNLNLRKCQEVNNKSTTKIVYIDQGDLIKYKYHYETELQKKTIAVLSELHNDYDLNVYVKFHPNRSKFEKKIFSNKYQLEVLQKIDKKDNYIFVNLYSTSFYDMNKYGRFLFVGDKFFRPQYFFGKAIDVVHIGDLKNIILRNVN